MDKNLYVAADPNVKINFDLRNKVSQRITSTYRFSKNRLGTKSRLSVWRKAVEFDPDGYQKFKYHRYVQKSYVPTPLRL